MNTYFLWSLQSIANIVTLKMQITRNSLMTVVYFIYLVITPQQLGEVIYRYCKFFWRRHSTMQSTMLFYQLKGSLKEPNKFHIYETEKITRKAKCRGRIYRVIRFFHLRSSCTTHLMLFSERPPIYVSSCMTISDERTEQLNIFCCVTGFTSDFRPP